MYRRTVRCAASPVPFLALLLGWVYLPPTYYTYSIAFNYSNWQDALPKGHSKNKNRRRVLASSDYVHF